MKKIIDVFYKTILVILCIFVLYASYCAIFNIYDSIEKLSPLVLILGIIVVLFTFVGIRKLINKITEKKSDVIAIVLCIIFVAGLCFVGSKIRSVPVFDLSNIEVEAKTMLNNGRNFENINYFAKYTNQIPLTVFVYYIYNVANILNISDLKMFATVINSIFIGATAFITYLSLKKIKDYKIGLLSLIFFIINPVFYLYASYYYTDTMCMPFAAFGFYLFICALKNDNYKKYLSLLLASGIIFAIGFKIRVVVGILLIGTLMGTVISNKFTKKLIIKLGAVLLGFIIGLGVVALIFKSFNMPYNKNLEFPPTHWIMMGLNEQSEGIFSSTDHNKTKSKKTYSEKVKYNVKTIRKRIKNFGLIELARFDATKISINWSNGDYNYIETLGNVENNNKLYNYTIGNKRIFLVYYMQILKASILLILFICLINEIKNKEQKNAFSNIYISVFGAFLFYLLWEVKARYSLSFLPWIIMIFGIGISHVENILTQGKILKIKNLNRIVAILTLTASTLMLVINFYYYTIKEEIYYDTIISQVQMAGKGYVKIANNSISQTFNNSKSFDCIELKFMKKKVKAKTNYNFYLKDKDGKILVEKQFTSNDVKNREYERFEFEQINPTENTLYTIEVNSSNASKDDTLCLEMFYRRNNDSYPGGIMKIGENEKEFSDLLFKVKNKEKRPYVGKIFYIFISVIIIIIEIFAFYPYIKYNKKERKILEEGE